MLPYPLLTLSLLLMWLLLNGFTFGHLVLGILVAVFASWAMASLRPDRPRLGKWHLLPKLFAIVLYDIVKSNIAVALVILKAGRRSHNPGFLTVEPGYREPHGDRGFGGRAHEYSGIRMAGIRFQRPYRTAAYPRPRQRGGVAQHDQEQV